ncbi:DUF5672 family protein [Viscerimonas tarda]
MVIVIPVYKTQPDRFERTSFIQCLKVLGKYSFSLVTYEGLDVSCYTNLFQQFGCQYKLVVFDKEYFKGWASYNKLLLSRDFYGAFNQYRYMLIYQLDAYVFEDELADWCDKGYDYVGAPWFEDFGNSHTVSDLKAVGNGGFSLRNIPSFLAAFDYAKLHDKRISPFNYWNRHLMKRYYGRSPRFILSRFFGKSNTLRYFLSSTINEDTFWSQIVPEAIKTFKVAPIEEAVRFSFETDPAYLYDLNNRKLPFGCHAWQKNQFDLFWSDYIKPEND